MNNTRFTLLCFVVLLTSTASPAQRISAGGRHSLAICADSTVEAWGYNGFGQLGNGNITEQHSGTQVSGLTSVIHVAGGLFHSLFVKSNGTVWACGRNNLGPLGDGTNTNSSTPVQVSGLSDIIQAAGGGEHSLFLKSDSTVWACGNNASGQLGDGTNVSKNAPVQISGLSGVVQVAGGAEYSLFLKKDGTVWACGHNGYGQFGNGTNTSSNVPVLVSGLSDIVQLSTGEWHSLFVKNDGTVYSSGRNQYGQLGIGTTADTNTVAPITTLAGIIQAEAGGIHSVFLKNDGTVWSCGLNSGGNNDGQLGDGTSVDKHTPVQVIPAWGSGNIIRSEATREHSLFLTSEGFVWAAGRNNYGQLGYGDFTSANSDTPVLSDAVCNTLPTSQEMPLRTMNTLQIFPNPGNGIFYAQSEHTIIRVEVFDILGTLLYSLFNTEQNNVVEVNLTGHAGGIYFLRIKDSNSQIRSKTIVLR